MGRSEGWREREEKKVRGIGKVSIYIISNIKYNEVTLFIAGSSSSRHNGHYFGHLRS